MDRALGLWFIVWFIIRCCGRTHEAHFYQGCINVTDSWRRFDNEKTHFQPFSCVGLCNKQRYAFAAVQNGSFCYCNSSIDHHFNETECNIRCASNPDLHCGGANALSVYSTAVPFILSASIAPTSKTVQVNTNLTFEFSVLIRRPSNEVVNLHFIQKNNKSLNNIYITWKINNISLNYGTYLLNGNTTSSSLNVSLRRPGFFLICVSAKNLVSDIKRCSSLDVLLPVSGLNIVDNYPRMQLFINGKNTSLVTIKSPFYLKATVNKGTNVTFFVSFGDNTSLVLNASSSTYDPYFIGPSCVTAWHSYAYCGNFFINVMAFNAFSNQTLPGIPVVAQERIKFASVNPVSGLPGTLVQLVVDLHGGCGLSYEWTFGDGSPSVTSQVPNVSHIFNETNSYKITVRIYNIIGTPYEVVGFVYIQSKLSNVSISIQDPLSSPKNIYSTGTNVKFLAHPKPEAEASNVKYRWFVNDGAYPDGSIEANLKTHEQRFRTAGSFLAYVVARNKVSSVKSKPIPIIIEDQILGLKLKHVAGKIVPGEEIVFNASMMSGSNVMLIWDFGDGIILTTNKTLVSHVYNREKVYDVEVMVYNNISQQNASLTAVVTKEGSCQPPAVEIIRWQKIKVNRFEEVHFETEVTLDCNTTSGVIIYQWEIFQMPSNKKLNNVTLYMNEPTLIIPPYTLPYGVHAARLKVYKEGTPELYSKAFVKIAVEKVGLIANIKGGSTRVVGYESKQNVSLDGSGSLDPDYPEDKDQLRFKWDCHLMGDIETSCFDPRFNLSLHQPILTFPVQWLQTGKNAFFVTLNISKHGHTSKETWQIIRMVDAEPHLLTVHCPQCEQGEVNPSVPLLLQGSCLTCPWSNQNVTFQWDLYLISSTGVPQSDSDPKCVSPVTETVHKNNPGMTTPVTKRRTRKPATTQWSPSRRVTIQPTRYVTGRRPTGHYKTGRPNVGLVQNQGIRVERGNVCNGPITLNPTVTPTTRCKYVPRKPSYGFAFRRGPTASSRIWVCSTTTEPTNRFKTHSRGFGSGTVLFTHPTGSVTGPPRSPARPKGYPTSKPGTNEAAPTSPAITPSIGALGSMYDPDYIIPTTQQQHKLLRVPRLEMSFPDSWSATGKTNRNFLLAPGKLKAGYTYIAALNAEDKFKTNEEHRRGMANVFFKVNKNPNIGGCSVGPRSGYEMDTVFGIKCKHGIVEDKLSYQVTCKIHGDEGNESMLIYTGFNEHPMFRLPAGNSEHGYKVSVHISVFNYKRTTTVKICPVNITVRPTRHTSENMPTEDLLINKTKEKILILMKVGEEQKVKQLVNILTKALNRYNSTAENKHKRYEIRTELLRIIKQFRVRDEPSAIQTGEAIDVITSVKNEVNIQGLKLALEMLFKVARQLNKARSNEQEYIERLVHLVTKLSSNLLAASSYMLNSGSNSTYGQNSTQRGSNLTYVQNFTRKVLFQVLQLVIKTKLNHLLLGEKPVKLIQPSLGVLISKSLLVSQSRLALQNVSFLLPSNIARHLGMNSRSYSSACLGTVMVVYENNPYMWSDNQPLHYTKVSSLELTSCHGDVKIVKNLSQEMEINLPWLKYKYKDEQEEHTVKWQYLNTHTININNQMKNHSLQVKIKTLSKITSDFKLKVLVSTSEEERLQHSQTFKSTPGGSVIFFLTSGQLKNSSGAVRVGVVIEDSAQNRMKKIFKVSPVNYSISSKWIGCFYWEKNSEKWSSQGCRATEKTTQVAVNCKCNHLTSFSAAAFLAPNPLSVTDLRKIVSIGNNLVCTALVACLILLYIFLMILCVRADRQDRRKDGVVDLGSVPCRNPHRYKITLETGHWFGSGTTANVMIRLHGENATSDAIELIRNGKPVFQRGSRDVFLIKSPWDLSPVWKVHVWHYNEGDSPSWYLNRVIIKDMTTKEKWYFDSYRWLAVDQEDGRIDVELMANPGLNDKNFQCLYHNCVQYLVDYHLWLSVAGRPPYSRFTRAQRLTCCLSLILSTLCVSAAWYKTDDTDSKPLQLLGFLDITWYTLVRGIVCSLIVLPVNLLWMLVFRYSKSSRQKKKVHPSPLDEPITDTSCLPNTITADTGTPDDDTLSLLDQTIETLLYLKTLGSKMRWQPSFLSERSSLDSFFATNSLDDELSYMSDPIIEESRLSTKENACSNKSEGAHHGPQCLQCKDQSSSSNSSQAFISLKAKRSSRLCRIFSVFPYYFVYIGWIGCAATIVAGVFFTIWYGLSFGREKSVRWLQTLCIALLESFFISQPLMVLAFMLWTLITFNQAAKKTDEVTDEDEGFQDFPSSYINMAFDRTQDSLKEALEMKRHQRYLKFLKPLQKSFLSDVCEKKQLERTTSNYFKEVFLSLVLLILACLLVSGLYCGCAFGIQNSVQKTILRQFNHGNGSHGTVDQWWKDNHDKIVELLYWKPTEWKLRNNTTPEVYFKNSQSVLVGRPRIRQFKTNERQMCVAEGNSSERLQSSEEKKSSARCWRKCALDEGRWSSIEFSRTKSEAIKMVRQLISVGWVSICTQRITSEFLIYSASQDVFSIITLEVIGQLSGAPNINIQVNTLRGTLEDTTYAVFLKVCKVLFVVTYLWCLFYELSTLARMKREYFKSVAKYLALSCLLLSSLSIMVYIYWSITLYNLFREMLTKLDDDVFSAGKVVYLNQELLVALYSMLIFALILKFIHLLMVFKFVQRFCSLLSATSYHLMVLMVFFVLFTVMFSHTGYLVFGCLNSNFKTVTSSYMYTSGLLKLRGHSHFIDVFYTDRPVFSILYLALYTIGMFIFLRGLSVSMFSDSYHPLKRRHFPTHVVVDYLFNLYSRLFLTKNIDDEPYESDDDDDIDGYETDGKQIIPVEYACDEVEFQMEELLFKLDNLAGTGGLKGSKLTYSSDILSGDERDDDVEYLYRSGYPIPDQDICGSGYESDQSLFSLGSANQEGLTDLEKERKISKDSSTLTISESNHIEQPRTLVKPDSLSKLGLIQSDSLTPKQLYRRHSENSGFYSTDLKVEPRNLQSSSGTSMSSRRPSLTKESLKPKHLYTLTRKPKIRNGQVLLPEATLECSLDESFAPNVDDSTTSEENEDRKSAKTKSKSSKKPVYRRALGFFPKTSVAPMSNDTDLPVKLPYEAFIPEVSSLSSPDASYDRRSSSSSDENQRDNRMAVLHSAFAFNENQPTDQQHNLVHPLSDEVPPLSPSEPGFGINSQDFCEVQDNLGFMLESTVCPPGLIQNICMNTEIGTEIVSVDDEKRGQIPTVQTRGT